MLSVLAAVALFTLLCVLGFLWTRRRRAGNDVVPDARISTLVFPPESKFQASVLPRR